MADTANTYGLKLADFIDKRETALVGREHGEETLKLLKERKIILKSLEENYDHIIVIIPEKIVTINKSFFLGLFETRIQELGEEKFKQLYDFQTTEHIRKKIDKHISAALLISTQKEILDDSAK
jgi:hypothetical protein